MKIVFSYLFCLLLIHNAISQNSDSKKLHAGINRDFTNNYNPKLSADGRLMIFSTDLEEPRKNLRFFSSNYVGKERWSAPLLIGKELNFGTTNSFGGYFITYDDSKLIFASQRSKGVGGFDIWIADREADGWSVRDNLGKPFNSDGHEGDPSLSPDGNEMYFCKCQSMTTTIANGCKIVVSKKRGSGYSAPTDLPSNINTGNSMSPLILADGKTLIFASDKLGGKGGLDLFLTKKENNKWTDPIPLEYLNTPEDERYLSIPAMGDKAYFSKKDGEYNVLMKSMIPEVLRQEKLMWVKGTVEQKDGFKPVIQVTDMKANNTVNWEIDNKGNYSLFLPQGTEYDIAVRDLNGKFWYSSHYYDITELEKNKMERLSVKNDKIVPNIENEIKLPLFNNNFELTTLGKLELDRLTHILQKNSNWNLEINSVFNHYKEDTVKSIEFNQVKYDTVAINDTSEIINSIYHNDQSDKLKSEIEKYLTSKKIPGNRFSCISKYEGLKEGEENLYGYLLVKFK